MSNSFDNLPPEISEFIRNNMQLKRPALAKMILRQFGSAVDPVIIDAVRYDEKEKTKIPPKTATRSKVTLGAGMDLRKP